MEYSTLKIKRKKDFIRESVKQLLASRGLEELGTDANLNCYIKKAKANGAGGNEYLIALNTLDLIIFNEGSIAGRHYGLITPADIIKAA